MAKVSGVVVDLRPLVEALLALIRTREGGRSVDVGAARAEAQRLLDEGGFGVELPRY